MSGAHEQALSARLLLMMNTTATAIFQTDLASNAGQAPEWIEIFPAGPGIVARDGRQWTLQPQLVLEAFAANRGPLAIDYEHGQALKAPLGDEAPAAGWIVQLEERDGGIWGKVEWVEKAARQIVAREYRFISPDFNHDKSGVITRLRGAGLVNRPALVMTALAHEAPKEIVMLKAIAQALGLNEDADEQAILADLSKRKSNGIALCQTLNLPDDATFDTAIQAVKTLKDEHALAHRSDTAAIVTDLQTRLTDTQTALAQLQDKESKRDIELALDDATKAGKITPASRETYRAMCALEGGLQRFTDLVQVLPVIAAPSGLAAESAQTAFETDEDPSALAARANEYRSEQAAKGIEVTITQAVAHVKENKE